jgi:hypothetical protein
MNANSLEERVNKLEAITTQLGSLAGDDLVRIKLLAEILNQCSNYQIDFKTAQKIMADGASKLKSSIRQ